MDSKGLPLAESGGRASGFASSARFLARRARQATAVLLPGLAAALLVLLLFAHAGLIAGGQWQGDEWFNFALFRTQGTGFLANRVLTWSPRPVSELLVFLYARAVDALHRPLITPVLALLWATLAACAATLIPGPVRDPAAPAAAHVAGAGAVDQPRRARGLIVLAVLAFFLLGHQVAEMFYWPMGAAAYMAAIAALALLVMLVLRGRHLSRGGAVLAAAAMVVAAGSAEVGAMAVGGATLLLGAAQLRRHPARAALLLVPLAAALLVLVLILHGRAAAGVALGPETATIHALWPSLRAAAAQFAHETLALDAYPDGWPGLAIGAATKLALFLALRALCRAGLAGSATPCAHLWALAAALLAASFLSIAAALWQFGLVCCQRHDSFRQCLDVLVLLLLAALAARASRRRVARSTARLPDPRRDVTIGSAWLLLALALALSHRGPLMRRLPSLQADYRHLPALVAARNRTWASADTPGPDMVFHGPPQGFVVGETDWPAGTFTQIPTPPWFMQGILLFYGKQRVTVVQDPAG
jgi:hypothetical protein